MNFLPLQFFAITNQRRSTVFLQNCFFCEFLELEMNHFLILCVFKEINSTSRKRQPNKCVVKFAISDWSKFVATVKLNYFLVSATMSKRIKEISREKLLLEILEDGISPIHPNFREITGDYISRLFGINPDSPALVWDKLNLDMDKYCIEVEKKWKKKYDERVFNQNKGKACENLAK